jgi:hypothetical protein
MRRFAIAVSVLLVVVVPTTASAATPLTWVAGSGLGSDAVPCAGAEHWVLSDATQVTDASLLVGGTTYAMQQDNGNEWSVDTDAPIVLGDIAVATYDGDGTPTISLGSCTAASSPTPTPTPTPTPSPSDPPGGVPSRGAGGGTHGGGGASITGHTTTSRAAGDAGGTASRPFVRNGGRGGGAGALNLSGGQPTQGVDPASGSSDTPYVAGGLDPAIGDGTVTSGLPDPRKPPVLLVIAVLTIIASVSAVAAKRKLSHPAA